MAGIDHSSYYTRTNSQSAALLRARRPYLVKNAITGLGVAGIAIGVYVYTITAVGQDEFEDVKVPDVPVQQAQEINAPKK
ncbi:Cytochrome c oxidase assembly factor 3, mitochondrial [Cytospora mali]|uniref:Cytochrome c oxidase assembly factor 3 n=1 Tax=Cytospora mali TaxID=578113 RepID=A0A194V970_CYTMA|nr:Cytochrome c oxidase assembly factor 3, mitochondrial [Valsa mali var. pyri (nom. inval.)]